MNPDYEMKFLGGDSISVGSVEIYPLTLGEIKRIGESRYNALVSYLMINKNYLLKENIIDYELSKDLSDFEVFVFLSYQDESFRNIILEALTLFTRESISFHEQGLFYFGELSEERFLSEQMYSDIQTIVKKQNFIEDKEDEYRPANSRAAELIEKMRKAKEKIQKQNKEDGINLKDIIEIVACYSNDINLTTVWNLTVYQLYVAYLRLIMWDDYHSKYILLPHVTDQDSLGLKHWASKINLKNN